MKYLIRHKTSGRIWRSDRGNYLFSSYRGCMAAFNGSSRGGTVIDNTENAKNCLRGGSSNHRPMGIWSEAKVAYEIVQVPDHYDTHEIAHEALMLLRSIEDPDKEVVDLIKRYEGEKYETK